MTGFGKATFGQGQERGLIEIRSLNHRFFEYSSKVPAVLMPLEGEIKNLVQSGVKRGKISLFINLNDGESSSRRIKIDQEKLEFYYRNLRKAGSRLRINSDLSLRDLIHLPDIFWVEREANGSIKQWPRVRAALKKAVADLIRMKIREGTALKKEILSRISLIEKSLEKITRMGNEVVLQYQKRLKARVGELTSGLDLDREKLSREVAIMADRSDITEETVRLGNHLKLFRSSLEESEEIGKKLDFITQEMNRESNTIASKSVSFEISQEVVSIKSEIEKIREQIQNIE